MKTIRDLVIESKNIFILEDDTVRISLFKKFLIGKNLSITTTAIDAISMLKSKKFDILFCDHDLGGQVYVNSEHHNTGYQVIKALSETVNANTFCIVHSMNPAGADNMLSLLDKNNSAYVPFHMMAKTIL